MMFALPSWLINATGAQQFANNPANGFQPTIGDAFQGIGHSMMDHYRRSLTPSGSQAPGVPGGAPQAGFVPPMQMMVPPTPVGQIQMPQAGAPYQGIPIGQLFR